MDTLLHGRVGPFPVWLIAGVVVIGGVVFFIWWRNNQANNSSNATPTNSLNPTNDPNIDPNTGVPYSLEEMVDPNTGIPYYFENNPGAPQPPAAPAPKPTPNPIKPTPKPKPKPCPKGYVWDSDHDKCVKSKSSSVSVPGQFGQLGPPVSQKIGSGPSSDGMYTFTAGPSGQTSHIGGVAIDQYGVTSASDINNTSAAIIRSNPNLAGQSQSYQPPVGTRIYLPNM